MGKTKTRHEDYPLPPPTGNPLITMMIVYRFMFVIVQRSQSLPPCNQLQAADNERAESPLPPVGQDVHTNSHVEDNYANNPSNFRVLDARFSSSGICGGKSSKSKHYSTNDINRSSQVAFHSSDSRRNDIDRSRRSHRSSADRSIRRHPSVAISREQCRGSNLSEHRRARTDEPTNDILDLRVDNNRRPEVHGSRRYYHDRRQDNQTSSPHRSSEHRAYDHQTPSRRSDVRLNSLRYQSQRHSTRDYPPVHRSRNWSKDRPHSSVLRSDPRTVSNDELSIASTSTGGHSLRAGRWVFVRERGRAAAEGRDRVSSQNPVRNAAQDRNYVASQNRGRVLSDRRKGRMPLSEDQKIYGALATILRKFGAKK